MIQNAGDSTPAGTRFNVRVMTVPGMGSVRVAVSGTWAARASRQASAWLVTWLAVSACGRASLERHEYTALRMGTEARLVFYASDTTEAHRAARAAFARLAELDSLLSHFRDDSEVAVLARADGMVPVSDDLWTVVVVAHRVARATDGLFDVTRGRWRALRLDPMTRSIPGGIPLDLGAIGKGYGADEALRVLASHGITRALVVFGGELVAGGPPPGAAGWVVQVGDTTTLLAHGAISTSGLGLPPDSSVSVRAPTGLLADPLATATALCYAYSATVTGPSSPTASSTCTRIASTVTGANRSSLR